MPKVSWQVFCNDGCHDEWWAEVRRLAKEGKVLDEARVREIVREEIALAKGEE
jgi:hypothetical protein